MKRARPADARPLEKLLEQVRYRAGRGDISAQRQSFAIGSAALENNSLTRSSIIALAEGPASQTSAEIEVHNLVQLYDFVVSTVQQVTSSNRRLNVTPELIKKLHMIGLSGLTPEAGRYRTVAVAVMGSNHRSPHSSETPELVEAACQYINREWDNSSAIHLAAYALWRVLWIHPFADGNGRVARALSYLVLSLKSGAVLPGTPTLPALIAQNREAYYSSLETADRAAQSGELDLGEVEKLISDLLSLQLTNSALLPDTADLELQASIEGRILRAPDAIKLRLFHTPHPKYRIWSQGPYLTLQVGTIEEVQNAVQRQETFGSPFPGLLSLDERAAFKTFGDNQVIRVLQNIALVSQEGSQLYLSPDTGIALSDVRCRSGLSEYAIDSTLYCIRLGPRTTEETCSELFDLLIARDIRVRTRDFDPC